MLPRFLIPDYHKGFMSGPFLTLSRSKRCGGNHTHTCTGLRVSLKLHQLIRGLVSCTGFDPVPTP